MSVSATICYLPLGIFFLVTVGLPSAGIPFIIATSLIHAVYFVLLGRAYETGDLSLVYPIARGTGPLLVPFIAIPFLGERLSPPGAAGIVLIVLGVVTLQSDGFGGGAIVRLRAALRLPAGRYAFATGVTIALYSVVDKGGVGVVHPLLYGYFLFAGSSAVSALYFLSRRRSSVIACWRDDRGSIIAAGFLSPLTYFMALVAFTYGQVSYLAPMRELSIVVAALLGAWILKERITRARLTSALITTVGVAVIGLGS